MYVIFIVPGFSNVITDSSFNSGINRSLVTDGWHWRAWLIRRKDQEPVGGYRGGERKRYRIYRFVSSEMCSSVHPLIKTVARRDPPAFRLRQGGGLTRRWEHDQASIGSWASTSRSDDTRRI